MLRHVPNFVVIYFPKLYNGKKCLDWLSENSNSTHPYECMSVNGMEFGAKTKIL